MGLNECQSAQTRSGVPDTAMNEFETVITEPVDTSTFDGHARLDSPDYCLVPGPGTTFEPFVDWYSAGLSGFCAPIGRFAEMFEPERAAQGSVVTARLNAVGGRMIPSKTLTYFSAIRSAEKRCSKT